MVLTAEEIKAVTGYTWREKQIIELSRRRIPFSVNGAGRLIVLRSDVFNPGKVNREEPNLDLVEVRGFASRRAYQIRDSRHSHRTQLTRTTNRGLHR